MTVFRSDGLSRPLDGAIGKYLSLGAGVQSTVLALMAVRGDIEKPDAAIFADTGWEPKAVYEHLDWLESVLPYPLIRVRRAGLDLGEMMLDVAKTGVEKGNMLIPYFPGSGGMVPKQCSKEFKTRPVAREICRLNGIEPGKRGPKHQIVEMWLGISCDEMQRMKDNEKKWIHNRWPLIEARMTRRDCLTWLSDRQYKAPRSSCIFCPFRTREEWLAMKETAPDDFARVSEFDVNIRAAHPDGAYLTRDRLPISAIDFSKPDTGEADIFGLGNECEGMCGV